MGTKFTVIPCERATGTRVAVVPRYIDFIFYNFQGIQARTEPAESDAIQKTINVK